VAKGTLREDLLYRLRVVPINLPPLRKRQEDIPLLTNHFLALYWDRHRGSNEAAPKLSDAAIEFLRARQWRGNVRELQNVIEQLAVLTEPGHAVMPDDVPVYEDASAEAPGNGLPMSVMTEPFHLAKDKLITHFEKEYLSQLVARAGSNMSKAARLANIDRTTLYRLMEKHGFRRDELVGSVEE
jgi:DNA-binding NtrC family response regulator